MKKQLSLPHTKNKNWLTIPTTDRILFEYDGDEQWRQGLEIASQQMVDQFFYIYDMNKTHTHATQMSGEKYKDR